MVDARGERSSIRCFRAGLPQGSVLGPVLYTIFTADLPYPWELRNLLGTYADITAFIASSKCRDSNHSKLVGPVWRMDESTQRKF